MPHAAFLAEGQAIPVVQGTSSPGVILEPYRLATAVTLTGEMIRHSNAEAFVRQVLAENVGPTLDAAMLSSAAAVSGVRPAGILNGISALTPTAAGSSAFDAMVSVSGKARHRHRAGLRQWRIRLHRRAGASACDHAARRESPPRVLASSTLAAGTVIAVAVNASWRR